MQISLKWINELIHIDNIELDELITKLTLGGFEVEEILEIEINHKKTVTLDISATANRSDSLSIQGISLEIAALLNHAPKISKYRNKNFDWLDLIKNVSSPLLTDSSCLGFIAITVENLTKIKSPKWIKHKLRASGITPENNLVDFQNYLLLETGYPFEFYDLNKLYSNLKSSEFSLSLSLDNSREKFLASNDLEYQLDKSTLILKANDLPIGIAGIISSQAISYSETTNAFLIEGSIFNAAKIRQQSRILGLRTERSSRYEKSLKNTNLLKSFYRLICLLRIENPNLICKVHTISQPITEPFRTILLDYKNIKTILGPINKTQSNQYQYISPELITDCLKRLRFEIKYNKQNLSWNVTVPDLRSDDITCEIDLIEEIGRLYGFNNFLTRLPNIDTVGMEDFHYQTRKKISSCLLNLGLNELIQYSLVNEKTYSNNKIQLINPLVKEYASLRSSLLPNLIKAVEENIKNGNLILEGFEYGHIFERSNIEPETIHEKEYVAGIFGGSQTKLSWTEPSTLLNWFEAKGKIDQLLSKLNIGVYWQSSTVNTMQNILHPYRTAELYLINGRKLGVFGQISPILAKKLNIALDIYLFEFDFELIQNQMQQTTLSGYKEYSLYPKITKDLSFIVHNEILFNQLKSVLFLNGTQFLNEINLLDEYRGESIPDHHTSLCVQLTFQSNKETLQNKQIDKIIENLKKILSTKFNAIIRS